MMVKLVIIGGGYGFREVASLVTAINSVNINKKLEILGILDDDQDLANKNVGTTKVLGKISDWKKLPSDIFFVFAIGGINSRISRKNLLEMSQIPINRFYSLIHPNVELMIPTESLGFGLIIHGGVKINPLSAVGNFCLFSPNCIIGVENTIGSYSLFSACVATGTNIQIGSCSFFGTGTVLAPDIKIGPGSQIGVGSVVFRDVTEGHKLLGNPAKPYGRDEIAVNLIKYSKKDTKNLLRLSDLSKNEVLPLAGGRII